MEARFLASIKSDLSLRRIALIVQYDGTNFCGWQKQKSGISIQGVLEESISFLDPIRPVNTVAAGRTDSGVHASGQVVHFDYCGPIPVCRWVAALNGRLPKTIRVLEAVERPLDWHACYSAKSRRYRYSIFNGSRPNLFLDNLTWHRYKTVIDETSIEVALKQLIGFYDFSAFQRAGSNRDNAWTTVKEVSIQRNGDLIFIEIEASGFLYGMVRLLVGQLVAVGENRLSLADFERRWRKRLRSEVRESAPAKALCLLRVGYEDQIFSHSASFDTFPSFSLPVLDPPQTRAM